MLLVIDRTSGEITRVSSFDDLEGAEYNQHWRAPGKVLVEVDFRHGTEVKLFHPETRPEHSGHVGIYYCPQRHDSEYGVDIQRYRGRTPMDFQGDGHSFKLYWPEGEWDLIKTIDAIENFLAGELESYVPQLGDFIARTFQQTPKRVEAAEEPVPVI